MSEIEINLLEHVKREEKNHNWVDVAKNYDQLSKLFIDKNELVKAAKIFKKLGHAYNRAAEMAKTSEDYVERNKLAINAYDEAIKIYEQIENKCKQLECLAEVHFINGFLSDSIDLAKQAFNESSELFIFIAINTFGLLYKI